MKRAKSPFKWTSLTPRVRGFYWYRESEDHIPEIVYAYRDKSGEWSVIYGDLRGLDSGDFNPEAEDDNYDFIANYHGQWSHVSIPEPT